MTTLLLCGVFPLLPPTQQPFGTVWNQQVLPLFRISLDFDGEGRQTSSNWFDFFFLSDHSPHKHTQKARDEDYVL